MAVLCMVGSILTLMAISVERYFAIVHPLRPRMTEKTTVCVATGIWFFSTLLSLPYLIFSYTYTDERTTCYLEWPDSPENDTDLQAHFTISEQVYNATFMFSTYVVPLIIISYAYARVGIELWGSHIVGEATPHQLESLQAKRKANSVFTCPDEINGRLSKKSSLSAPLHPYCVLHPIFMHAHIPPNQSRSPS
ncbi:hypothetical protein QYM36_004507 [Artemia franciscana]|uniref:G-protein coupled receptors family 1 profile domain-containing protein n=1 Tax=Artemia franciscana TaxID=6661 RepID=A0AA88I2W4_ARTSF|nr:hypothetical protein QYM36_004507 [Artemia franciscana]